MLVLVFIIYSFTIIIDNTFVNIYDFLQLLKIQDSILFLSFRLFVTYQIVQFWPAIKKFFLEVFRYLLRILIFIQHEQTSWFDLAYKCWLWNISEFKTFCRWLLFFSGDYFPKVNDNMSDMSVQTTHIFYKKINENNL